MPDNKSMKPEATQQEQVVQQENATPQISVEEMVKQSYQLITNIVPVVRDLSVLEDQGIIEVQQLNKYIEQKRIVSEKPKQKQSSGSVKSKKEDLTQGQTDERT